MQHVTLEVLNISMLDVCRLEFALLNDIKLDV